MSEDGANRALVDVEQLMITRNQLGRTLAALVLLALLGATSCTTKPDVTRLELNDNITDASVLLRFEVVRSILEDSKGNFWFGSWKEGVCRFDGKSLTYFTAKDGLSDNQIRSIQEDKMELSTASGIQDGFGQRHDCCCKTSVLTGVYWRDDPA
ncbi:MAG: two-component regulator propeller domain-containing protein [Planctomycetota bacterium]